MFFPLNPNLALTLNPPGDAGIKSKITIKTKPGRAQTSPGSPIAHPKPQIP